MDRELILPTDFADYAWEVESKGYLDARVRAGERVVDVSFYDPTRLAQDIAEEVAAGRLFSSARLLVLARVTPENMQAAIANAPARLFE